MGVLEGDGAIFVLDADGRSRAIPRPCRCRVLEEYPPVRVQQDLELDLRRIIEELHVPPFDDEGAIRACSSVNALLSTNYQIGPQGEHGRIRFPGVGDGLMPG